MKREHLGRIIRMEAGPARTAALAEWVQDLFGPEDPVPVLVGGGAVELYTGGAYVTGDLDFAGSVTSPSGKLLAASGFLRKGRHWIHEEGRIFLEFPTAALAAGEIAQGRRFEGHLVLIVSPEDLIADRLSGWIHWNSGTDGVNAYLLYRALADQLDGKRLVKRCREVEATAALTAVKNFYRDQGGAIPDGEVMQRWAAQSPRLKR